MYDDEGNYIGEEIEAEEGAKKKGKGKKKVGKKNGKKKAAAAGSDSDSEGVVDIMGTNGANPFAEIEEPVLGNGIGGEEEAGGGIIREVDNDRLGDEPVVLKGKTEAEKKREEEEAKARKEYQEKMAERKAALEEEKKARRREARPQTNPMGHFVNEASVDKGLVSDGIYGWSNMGMGKMPLKVKKQWQMTADDVPRSSKRSRKNGYVPRE